MTLSSTKLESRDDQEKMDLLWEDFNEELTAITSSKPRVYPVPGCRGLLSSPKRSPKRCVSEGRMMNRSSSGKMIVKVLKTVFLLPHNHHHYGGGGLFRPPATAAVRIKTNRSSW
ncbi:hypothetical protein LINPERHAP2_LOCUS32058 [Linum perenne]